MDDQVEVPDDPSRAERIRRRLADAWGEMGAAWGVAPAIARVHAYLMARQEPLTEREVREALGLSHRAASLALAEAEAWGIVERVPEPRRIGRRGPAGAAFLAVGDHWQWFGRVIADRLEGRPGRSAATHPPGLGDALHEAPRLCLGQGHAGCAVAQAERLANLPFGERLLARHQVRLDTGDGRRHAPGRPHLTPGRSQLDPYLLRRLAAMVVRWARSGRARGLVHENVRLDSSSFIAHNLL